LNVNKNESGFHDTLLFKVDCSSSGTLEDKKKNINLNVPLNVSNLGNGVISVGAAFQPRLIDCGFKAIFFRGWKATPTRKGRVFDF
jgi:hypothetical protein